MVNLNPTRGREQAGIRPVVIVSVNKLNDGHAGVVLAVPITSTDRSNPIHVRIEPPEGGLTLVSFAKCEDIRSISKERLVRYMGDVDLETAAQIRRRLGILLGL